MSLKGKYANIVTAMHMVGSDLLDVGSRIDTINEVTKIVHEGDRTAANQLAVKVVAGKIRESIADLNAVLEKFNQTPTKAFESTHY